MLSIWINKYGHLLSRLSSLILNDFMLKERNTLFVFITEEIVFTLFESAVLNFCADNLIWKNKKPKLRNFKLNNCILFFHGYNWIYTLTSLSYDVSEMWKINSLYFYNMSKIWNLEDKNWGFPMEGHYWWMKT